MDSAEQQPRIGSVARDESNTPMSQPTPPPVEGLPRFSSSPAAVAMQPPQPSRASLSALHISNLTTSNTQPTTQRRSPAVAAADEPRKVSVTRINALLNDEPSEVQPSSSSDWFGEAEPPRAQSQEDEATGIAALALASMMGGSGHASSPRLEQQQQQQRHTLAVAYPQPRAYAHHRPSDPLPPMVSSSQPTRGTASAFSPVAALSPPMQFRPQSRPSSVDPSAAYVRSPRVRVMSPAPVMQPGLRQRKPSAPPLPPPAGSFVPRASSGYVGYAPTQGVRPQYAHSSSPRVAAQTVYSEAEGAYPPQRFNDPQRAYSTGQQMPQPGYYYPVSPSQQQQQQQQQQQHPPHSQHPASTNAHAPGYPAYRHQPPYM
ncbi:hypothetical protein H4S02_012657 [Coemansia sp. RSA 2611]|nr:hypothetical protein H4S01_006749 [Coemansia sp. RSA 2610]KAJ2356884.1 hypothetical protein H4S02_012657 [Coemansia sp. RSA 2611]